MKLVSFSLLMALSLGTELTIVSQTVKALPLQDSYQITRLVPTTPEGFLNRGTKRGRRRNLQGAIRDFTRVIELNPNYAEAYLNRGLAYSRLGENQKAITDLQKAEILFQQQGNITQAAS